ncbi:hypothetical protein BC936DRAFT_140179 [Jimgerdemannia flammicorona]|uniref:PP4R3 EVH1-like domain-containing protein n=1 Tax=Jimgerdemannia flammicorona TaxID=994334 RepID=A0A433AXH8_9FUNG|nr:hypothetical protein BC936DRAFT_140179 [Jimgerdemannia flammicorona]
MDPKPRRVKLYQLGEQSNWEDKGTGYCHYTEVRNSHCRQIPFGFRRLTVWPVHYKRQSDDEAEIVVRSEEDSSVLLNSKIDKNRHHAAFRELDFLAFCRRHLNIHRFTFYFAETLIVWTNENNVDLALSFQEPEGCAEIWYVASNEF